MLGVCPILPGARVWQSMELFVPTPNLFTYATSELSQDAFLCWLLAWADPKHRTANPALQDVASTFVKRLFEAAGKAPPPASSTIEVRRQVNNVDIVAVVGGVQAVVIEDKTSTSNHSNQLDRYRAALGEEFGGDNLVCVYLKTGDQSSYGAVRAKGWAVFTRRDLLSVLRGGWEVKNDVFRQFVDHLEAIEAAVTRYATAPLGLWDSAAWRGFYLALQEALGDGQWGYVTNPSGGFMGFWWGWRDTPAGERVYLQLEERPSKEGNGGRLVVKVEVRERDRRAAVRDRWMHLLLHGLPDTLGRPARLGRGTWMTVGTAGEFRAVNAEGTIDMDRTVETLREVTKRVQRVIDDGSVSRLGASPISAHSVVHETD